MKSTCGQHLIVFISENYILKLVFIWREGGFLHIWYILCVDDFYTFSSAAIYHFTVMPLKSKFLNKNKLLMICGVLFDLHHSLLMHPNPF